MSGTDVRRTDTGSLLCCLMTMLVEVLSHSDPRRVRSNLLYCHDDPLGDAWGWLHRSFHSHWTIKQLRPLKSLAFGFCAVVLLCRPLPQAHVFLASVTVLNYVWDSWGKCAKDCVPLLCLLALLGW